VEDWALARTPSSGCLSAMLLLRLLLLAMAPMFNEGTA